MDPMKRQETLELVKAYYRIPNRKAAKYLFDLIVTMSKPPATAVRTATKNNKIRTCI